MVIQNVGLNNVKVVIVILTLGFTVHVMLLVINVENVHPSLFGWFSPALLVPDA